mgnify:CR=1 FL=1
MSDQIGYDYLLSRAMLNSSMLGKLVFMSSSGKLRVGYKPPRVRKVPEKVVLEKGLEYIDTTSNYMMALCLREDVNVLLQLLFKLPYGYGLGCVFDNCYFICNYNEDLESRFNVSGKYILSSPKRQEESLVRKGVRKGYSFEGTAYASCMRISSASISMGISGVRFNEGFMSFIKDPIGSKGTVVSGKSLFSRYRIPNKEIQRGVFEIPNMVMYNREKFFRFVNVLKSLNNDKYALHWDKYSKRWLFVENYDSFLSRKREVAFFKDNQECKIFEML